jgi:hypothetical protein
MQKLLSAAFAATLCLSHLMAMDPSPKSEEQSQEIIQDINDLKPYYAAIQKIRKALDSVANTINYATGFNVWPYPNPGHGRTPKYLFLETEILRSDYPEELVNLYTPFGEVKLLSGGFTSDLFHVSKEFLANIDWLIEEVTHKVHYYGHYDQKENRKIAFLEKESWKNSNSRRLYLIKSVGSINLFPDGVEEELTIFSNVMLAVGQAEKDRAQFMELSNERNCF